MKRKILLIFGRTGSGKTFFTKRLIKKINRTVIIDKLFEYDSETTFYKIEDLIDYILLVKPLQFNFVCRFTNDEDIEKLFILIWHLGNLFLVVEESELYISPYQKQSNFLKLVRYGRHRQISIIAVARRVVELSNDIKANSDKIISFKQILKRDLQYLETLGFNPNEIMNLKQFEFKEVTY